MKKLSIYDPAMCCPTGMCGVSIDPEFLRVATTLHTLRKNGIEVHRYNLASTPEKFVENKTVNDYINQNGGDVLPLTVIDDVVVLTKRYPTNIEITEMLGLSSSILANQPSAFKITPV
jgi:hypothetical protein